MNTPLMLNSHQDTAQAQCGRADTTPWVWTLDRRSATTLSAAPQARWLQVEAGKVWLTRSQTLQDGLDQPEDIWLGAGQSLALPAGSAWVLEAWPQARLSLLMQMPVAELKRPASPLPASWVRGAWWRQGLRRAGSV